MLLYGDHRAVVFALAFSPDGSTLASGAKDGSAIVRGSEGSLSSLCEAGLKTPAIHALSILPDGGVAIGHANGWHVLNRTEDAIHIHQFSDIPTTSIASLGPKPPYFA